MCRSSLCCNGNVVALLIHGLGTSRRCWSRCHLIFFGVFKHTIIVCHFLKVCNFVTLTVEIVGVFIVVVIAVVFVRRDKIVIIFVLKNGLNDSEICLQSHRI